MIKLRFVAENIPDHKSFVFLICSLAKFSYLKDKRENKTKKNGICRRSYKKGTIVESHNKNRLS